ncbi:zinc-ribbon family protein [Caloramator quimbayensis]|uniref:Zinc-ribbon family protein n=1 Tax=Caloramator quimbayensis TaxID=1147123 RepID=A0A1T4XNX6_9CLOT|nr:zinc ribbon domain-containing protein [Caloramator quimbayensis]SKA91246.1 zinc-ribbon family protein [Caloramator quimbayensis]
MFFIGIFGIETKQEEIKDIQNVICKACGAMTSFRLIKTYNVFHFFFIPIIKWSKKYYIISRCCNRPFEIPIEKGEEIERGRDIPLNDEDLRPLYNNYDYNICPNCKNEVDNNFIYCPYCGNKLR